MARALLLGTIRQNTIGHFKGDEKCVPGLKPGLLTLTVRGKKNDEQPGGSRREILSSTLQRTAQRADSSKFSSLLPPAGTVTFRPEVLATLYLRGTR